MLFYRQNRVARGGAEASAQSGEGSNHVFCYDLRANATESIAFVRWNARRQRSPNVHMRFWLWFPAHSEIATILLMSLSTLVYLILARGKKQNHA